MSVDEKINNLSKTIEANELEQEAARRLGITDEKLVSDHPELAKAREDLIHGGGNAVMTAAIAGGVSGLALASLPVIFAEKMAKSKIARGVVGAATALGTAVAVSGAYLTSASYKGLGNLEREKRLENKALMDELRRTPDGINVLAQVEAEAAAKAADSFAANAPQRDPSFSGQVAIEASQPSSKALGS